VFEVLPFEISQELARCWRIYMQITGSRPRRKTGTCCVTAPETVVRQNSRYMAISIGLEVLSGGLIYNVQYRAALFQHTAGTHRPRVEEGRELSALATKGLAAAPAETFSELSPVTYGAESARCFNRRTHVLLQSSLEGRETLLKLHAKR
jgi:hypothetical protein